MKRSESGLGRILRTMLTTGLAYVVNYGITLLLTPYIMETVGTEAYGFVSLAKQFADYAVILTMALNTYASRYIAISYHNGDKRQANTYLSSVFWGDLVLASALLTMAVWAILILEHLVLIPDGIVLDVKLLFLFVFLEFWVVTVFSAFSSIGYIKNRMDLTGLFKTLSCVTNAAVLVVLYILFPAKIYYVGIGLVVEAAIVAAADYGMTRRFAPELRVRRAAVSLSAVKKLVVEGCWASFNSIGDMLNNGLDLIICNQMLSSLAMGQLAVAKTMHTIVSSLYSIVDKAFIPTFLKTYAEGNKDSLLKRLKLSMRVSGLLANMTFAGFVALGLAYYRLWIPGQDIGLIYKLTIITISTCISTGAIHPLYYIYTLTVKKKFPCVVTIIGGIFNVSAMYVMIRFFDRGVYTVAWTTAFVSAFIGFITNPLYMAHVLQVPYGTFYPDILKNLISCAALVFVFKCLTLVFMPASWLMLVLCAGICVLIGVPIHLLIVCNRDEKRAGLGLLKDILKKT